MKVRRINFSFQASELRPDLVARYPKGARSIDLIRNGHQRTVTSPGQPLGEPGEIVKLVNTRDKAVKPVLVRVKAVRQLHREGNGLISASALRKWSRSEGLSKDYLLRQTFLHAAWQTEIETLSVKVACR